MSIDTYRVTCKHGHDAVMMTGTEALAHVQACRGRKALSLVPPTGIGWERAARRAKPLPWRAPKPDKEGLAGVMRRIAVGEYDGPFGADVDGCAIDGWKPPCREGLWRYDRPSDDLLPLHLLPTGVREILETAMKTPGARWALKIALGEIFVTVAQTLDDETRIHLRGKKVNVTVGSYRKPSTVAAVRRVWLDGAA